MAKAGGAQIGKHELTAGSPKIIKGLDQAVTVVGETAEANDRFGAAVSMVDYWPSGQSSKTVHTLIAIGTPGEDQQAVVDAGGVTVLNLDAASETLTLHASLLQGGARQDQPETGDQFGASVSLDDLAADAPVTVSTLHLAAGVPGEEAGSPANAGAVHMFPLAGSAAGADYLVAPGAHGVPAPTTAASGFGQTLMLTGTGILVLASGAKTVYQISWANITGTTGVTTPYPVTAGKTALVG
ncbi:hypothetical protein [Phytomonospora endophytica]|uniref:Uncharacterized protein n=1 Tax=Phytomonospora endophytica TaxID=714109 RepID=A0A841FRX9_9ACTN|nr:hypothetical protein [Phytomonospora endophytica]MBB6038554.1 hypothetical protein [Phytomonospora endophytica]GIG69306.1 hypothetical protein Pen01_56010 [Phytomonospora endophytica]